MHGIMQFNMKLYKNLHTINHRIVIDFNTNNHDCLAMPQIKVTVNHQTFYKSKIIFLSETNIVERANLKLACPVTSIKFKLTHQ